MDTRNERTNIQTGEPMKYCSHCGQKVLAGAVICPHCGCQIGEFGKGNAAQQPQVVINNTSSNVNTNTNTNAGRRYGRYGREKNKWAAFFLCLFLGYLGAHKFYEGKAGMGILYLFTLGLLGIGWMVDLIALLFKPNPYYV